MLELKLAYHHTSSEFHRLFVTWVTHLFVSVLPLMPLFFIWQALGGVEEFSGSSATAYALTIVAVSAVFYVRVDLEIMRLIRAGAVGGLRAQPWSWFRYLHWRQCIAQLPPAFFIASVFTWWMVAHGRADAAPAFLAALLMGLFAYGLIMAFLNLTVLMLPEPSSLRSIARLGMSAAMGGVIPLPLVMEDTSSLGPFGLPFGLPYSVWIGEQADFAVAASWLIVLSALLMLAEVRVMRSAMENALT